MLLSYFWSDKCSLSEHERQNIQTLCQSDMQRDTHEHACELTCNRTVKTIVFVLLTILNNISLS